MTNADRTAPIAVLGATGQQGGAVVDALLDAGAPVRAVVRDARSDGATALAGRGVEVVVGDQDTPESLVEPLRDVAALFLMTTFAGQGGTDGETERGNAVADVAARVGVPRIVYSSVGAAERDTGIPHFESKRRVEEHLAASPLPAQFVRPTFFYENLAGQLPDGGDGDAGGEFVLQLPIPAGVALQMVAARDIGRVCAAALLDAALLGGDGAAIEIAGDELTGEQMAAAFGRHLGRPARYEALPVTSLDDDDQQKMFSWFAESSGYAADFARTKEIVPDVLDLAAWLAQR